MTHRTGHYIYRGVLTGIYIVFAVVLLLLVGITVSYPDNHLISRQMLLGTVGMVIISLIAGAIWNKVYAHIGKRTILYIIALLGFGIALYFTSLGREQNAYTYADYSQVYRAAESLAEGGTIPNPEYFLIYRNNLKPMLLLSLLFRIAQWLRIPRFPLILAVNVLQVLAVIWGCGYLAEKEGDNKWRFPILVVFACFLPLWGMVSAFYTDSMSFGLGILGIACLKKGTKCNDKKRFFWYVAAAFVMVLAAAWKVTALIIVIAGGIILDRREAKKHRKEMLLCVVAFLMFYLGLNMWINTYEISKQSVNTGNPVISWVALGIDGNGSYEDNREFVDRLNELTDKKEKTAYSLERINAYKNNFFDKEHLVKKAGCNFADGNMGVSSFLFIEYDDGTLLWNMFSPWGKYYWRTSQYCFCYLETVYVLFLLGAAVCIYNAIKGKEILVMLMVCQLAFGGILLFLMLWEANSRQLYNQMPGLLLGSVLSLAYFIDNISGKKRRK